LTSSLPNIHITIKLIITFLVLASTNALSCDEAQMVDYDYQIKQVMGEGTSTFGRIWILDNQETCLKSYKYNACLNIEPLGKEANLTITIKLEDGVTNSYTQYVKYNTTEVIRYEAMSFNVYFKLYVSNAIADFKMKGSSCDAGFPNVSRLITSEELRKMYKD
jgi:hypothetical protein